MNTNKIHCGVNKPRSGKRRGTARECISKKQVYFYGYRPLSKEMSADDIELYFDPSGEQEKKTNELKKKTNEKMKSTNKIPIVTIKKKKSKTKPIKKKKEEPVQSIQDKIIEEREHLYRLLVSLKKQKKIRQYYCASREDIKEEILDLNRSILNLESKIRNSKNLPISASEMKKKKIELADSKKLMKQLLITQKELRKNTEPIKKYDILEEQVNSSKAKINELSKLLTDEERKDLVKKINEDDKKSSVKKSPSKKSSSKKENPKSVSKEKSKTVAKEKPKEKTVSDEEFRKKLPKYIEIVGDKIYFFQANIQRLKKEIKKAKDKLEFEPDNKKYPVIIDKNTKEIEKLTKSIKENKDLLEKVIEYEKSLKK